MSIEAANDKREVYKKICAQIKGNKFRQNLILKHKECRKSI